MADSLESRTDETLPPTNRMSCPVDGESVVKTITSGKPLPLAGAADGAGQRSVRARSTSPASHAESALSETIVPKSKPTMVRSQHSADSTDTVAPDLPEPVSPSALLSSEPSLDTVVPGASIPMVNLPEGFENSPPTVRTNQRQPQSVLPEGPPSFQLIKEIGRGAMGVVYKAKQKALNRLVALKMVLGGGYANEDELARFRTEAEAIARLSHPAIVQVYEIGEHDGMPYFAMEYCPGGSLASHSGGHPLHPERAARLLILLAEGMFHAHQAGIIHRDLKPANVLAMKLDEFGRAIDGPSDLTDIIRGTHGDLAKVALKIADFGLARLDNTSGQTRSGDVLGTPSYMAPEQAAGRISELSPQTDVWALGAILYDLLTGRPPFRGGTAMETVNQVLQREPVPLRQLRPDIPLDLETICHKCLQKDKTRRYATAKELGNDLTRFVNGQPIRARPIGVVERALRWAKRSPFQALSAATGVLLLLSMTFGLYGLYQTERLAGQAHQRDLKDERELTQLSKDITVLYNSATEAAAAGVWAEVERDTNAALELRRSKAALIDHPLSESLAQLRDKARTELANTKEKSESRERLAQFTAFHADAIVFASNFTGMEIADGRIRTHKAVTAALALFGINETNDTPSTDSRFFTPPEIVRITERCHELLLLEADSLARPIPGEPVNALKARLRKALALVDQADRVLGKNAPTRAGLSRQAKYLTALGKETAAAAAKAQAENTPPRLAADHFIAGLDRYRRADYSRATDSLSNVLREEPDHYGAVYLQSLCQLQLKRFQLGREGLTRCLELRPTFVWPRLLRGYAAIELEKFDEARADFDAVLANTSDDIARYVAHVNRAVLKLKERQWDSAIGDLKTAISQRPNTAAAYINLALVHRQRAELPPWQHALLGAAPRGGLAIIAVDVYQRQTRQDALRVLDDAVKHCPTDARLYHERGRLHLLLENKSLARDNFTKAIELAVTRDTGTLGDDLIELGRLLHNERRYEESVRAYQAAAELRQDGTAWRLMAQPLLALKRYDEAGKALDQFIKTIPVTPGKAPTPEQARTLGEAMKVRGLVHDEQARAFRERGALHLYQRDLRGALDSYTNGLKYFRDPETLTLRGWTYIACNSPELAHGDFDEAVKLKPTLSDALIGRATARVRLGKLTEATKDVEAGVAGGNSPRQAYNAARVHAQIVTALREQNPKSDVERSEKRATELLRLALERTPAENRATFWKQYVQADRAFDSVRRTPAMIALGRAYASPTR